MIYTWFLLATLNKMFKKQPRLLYKECKILHRNLVKVFYVATGPDRWSADIYLCTV